MSLYTKLLISDNYMFLRPLARSKKSLLFLCRKLKTERNHFYSILKKKQKNKTFLEYFYQQLPLNG